MSIPYTLSLLLLALILPEREIALGIWRRWLGSNTGHRWFKVCVLIAHELGWYAWAASPMLPGWPWTWPMPGVSPAALAALIGLPVYLTAICLWFLYGHNNGGYQGTGGPARYGWPGYGYLWAYPIREYIGEIKLAGWTIVNPCAWTEAAELYLGAMTGRLTGLALAALHILAWVIA